MREICLYIYLCLSMFICGEKYYISALNQYCISVLRP